MNGLFSPELARLIGASLFQAKFFLLLMLLTFFTGLATVWITHQTRLLIVEKGKLAFQVQTLDHELIHLTLEETTLMDKKRISRIVNHSLNMQAVTRSQEVLIEE